MLSVSGEKALETLRKRNEITNSNLSDDLKRDLLEGIERPGSMPRGIEGIHAKHSNYLANDSVETDSDYVKHVISFYREVYEEAFAMLAKWETFFKEISG